MNVLFVCSRNQWRSPTAEKIFQANPDHHFRSAGTADSARTKVSGKLLDWADLIFVMEKKHKQVLISRFGAVARDKEIIVLDIPDDYLFMDAELVEMLETAVTPFLETAS
ncbi:low molecular weight protein tyrosine phosphatase family protein [Rufibacter sediminis]|uniref:Protein tyrosine phosphatase n=1 Tax=Rufibacter sediminis TaxID=2762756 RepID=A0ABR6VN06_9BACT|nr:protein tyrosine phosphatase [Rufibacter sediminis]MBC3538576.1 protein tyrosine phosphatase [Rufibacter sediminis]